MPLYKYRCNDCDNIFKILQLNGEEEDPVCPKCDSRNVERMVSSVGIRFKGNGFYRTDYDNSRYKGNGGNGKGNGEGKETKGESSKEGVESNAD